MESQIQEMAKTLFYDLFFFLELFYTSHLQSIATDTHS